MVTSTLETGDHLKSVEFARRYARMSQAQKAELIEGVAFVDWPPVTDCHASAHLRLSNWLGRYCKQSRALGEHSLSPMLMLDCDNTLMPDLLLNLPHDSDGALGTHSADRVSGTPTLVCEVAGSHVSVEFHKKLNVYRRHSVPEYLVLRTDDDALDWFIWRSGQYDRLAADANGVIKSEHFPGLWLNVPAMLCNDMPTVFKTVDEGTATPEHAAFVARLKA